MGTRLVPTCDICLASPAEGFLIDPQTLEVKCLRCAFPSESERERITTDAVRELMRRFEREQGRRPVSVREFMDWTLEREG